MTALRRFFTDANGTIVIGQRPNIFITVYFVSWILLRIADNRTSDSVELVGTIALTLFALLELTTGVNPFRKTLGLAVLIAIGLNAL